MTEILSCAKDTQLHSFPGLQQLATSPHIVENGSYCHFVGSSRLLVRANKDWGIELLRIKPGGDAASRAIANVKKIMIDNLYCVACPKTAAKEELAVGLTTGTVRFMNYKRTNFTKRFDADQIAIGVTFMDFNATDDFLATVYENGLVNVYGMKTNSKVQTLVFDKNTVKTRFHPTKRFALAVASYNGPVLLYDTQTKKTIFSQPNAHGAPCRDVAMVEAYPDYLLSVGYDNVINIFDTRHKQTASQIQSNYPFESLAIAEDGQHFAVGNLKGYVYGYDLRQLKEPLNMQKLHQSTVYGVSFVPQASQDGANRRSIIEPDETRKTLVEDTQGNARKSEVGTTPTGASEQHDSFIGEIDMFLQRRDAPIDCLSRLSTSSRLSTDSIGSMQMAGNNLMGYLEDLSDCNIDPDGREESCVSNGSGDPAERSVDDRFVNMDRFLKRVKGCDGSRTNTRKGHTMLDNLENICEEASEAGEVESNGGGGATPTAPSTTTPLVESQQENRVATPKKSLTTVGSTPTWDKPEKENRESDPSRTVPTPVQSSITVDNRDATAIRAELAELRALMSEQTQAMRSDRMCMINLWRETHNKLESFEQYASTALGLLLPRDEFAERFLCMHVENEMLRARVKQLEESARPM
uniref:Protein NEDD1 n=1 Tax=Anopheles dirus TaxID=7168 RepID=A0A182MZE6_9DIPT